MKRILTYIINIFLLLLVVIIFNYFIFSYYTKYIADVSDNEVFDTYSQDVCYDETFKESITNNILTNEMVSENETIGYIYFPTVSPNAKGSINQGSLSDGQLGAMKYGVAHDPTTPLPGEDGNVVVAGHRETLFVNLQYLQEGDLIVLNVGNNVFLYEVTSTEIVDPENDKENAVEAIFNDDGTDELTLYTCYPFEKWKAFPNRYVVHAKPVQTSDMECSGGINE